MPRRLVLGDVFYYGYDHKDNIYRYPHNKYINKYITITDEYIPIITFQITYDRIINFKYIENGSENILTYNTKTKKIINSNISNVDFKLLINLKSKTYQLQAKGSGYISITEVSSNDMIKFLKNDYQIEYDENIEVTRIYKLGVFINKPTVKNGIEDGFQYFCTDKLSPESSEPGLMIYHKGSDVWVDSLGRVVDDNYPATPPATSGTTEERPLGVDPGFQYFDTTLNKPIWKFADGWVDSTGASV